MKKKNIIKMILMFFGYEDIEIKTFWTGTADGQFENSFAYDIKAIHNNGDGLSICENNFHLAIYELLMRVTDSDWNDQNKLIHYVDDDDFCEINN